ncbi:MAG: FAD-dependent oxidoreductase, partial [Zetaproteobacteria bacterium CG02_land_8_20_14_3_00_50_9]
TVHQCITPSPACIDIQLVQGSHLLLNRPCPGYVYTESLDGRVMFFRPWKGQTLAGTTETPLQDPPLNINPTASEICDILTTYNHYFPSTACDAHDIVRSFCGMRVLPQTHGSAFGASRETIMLCNPFGQAPYLAVYGGKLTTYRSESEKAVQLLKSFMPPPHKGSTRNMILSEHA